MDKPNTTGPTRMTRQRKVIMEALKHTTSHPTADEVYAIVRTKLPNISLATVYRNLVLLTEAGLASKLEMGGPPKRFDGRAATHCHIRCLSCGKVDDLTADPAIDLRPAMRALSGYEVTGHRLDIVGYCPRCKAQRDKAYKNNPGR